MTLRLRDVYSVQVYAKTRIAKFPETNDELVNNVRARVCVFISALVSFDRNKETTLATVEKLAVTSPSHRRQTAKTTTITTIHGGSSIRDERKAERASECLLPVAFARFSRKKR